jgi:HAD superfamily phosphoserine phosphatase-like hydrolase
VNTIKLSSKATEFVDSVLQLRPRLAAFDCDGTLWAGDAGEGFFSWEFERRMVSDKIIAWARARYADYKAGTVREDDMCGDMVTLHRGLKEADLERAAAEYFDQNIAPQIFPEMQELVRRLHATGCEIWAVSSTNEWVIRAAMKHFGIPRDRILAAAVEIENGVVTDRLVRIPSGIGKPRGIEEVVRRIPDVAFGNSRWDAEMLKIAKTSFAVNPNPDLEALARQRSWAIYFPDPVPSANATG